MSRRLSPAVYFTGHGGQSLWAKLLVMAAALAYVYVQLVHHVLWRDEYNVWGIACVSHSVRELLGRVHYEAHPALWYLLAYAASRVTHAQWMFKLLEGSIATAAFAVITLASPFLWWELALILFGYYMAFQYTVMCRMYSLELLFAMVYVWRRTSRPQNLIVNAVWLALLAFTDTTGAILATAFFAEGAWVFWRNARDKHAARLHLAGALAVFLAGCAVAVITMWPARDLGWSSTGPLFSEFWSGEHVGSAFAKWSGLAFTPQTVNAQTLWVDPEFWPDACLLPISLVCLLMTFWRKRVGVMFLLVAVAGFLFGHITNVSGVRHYGIEAIAFLVALWIMRAEGQRIPWAGYVLLSMLVIATIVDARHRWGRPFADDDDAAAWIIQQHLQDMPLMGVPDTVVVGVSERLGKTIYQIDCECWDPVMTFAKRRDAFHRNMVIPPPVIRGMQKLNGKDALLLTHYRLRQDEVADISRGGVQIQQLAAFERGYIEDEHFYIYRLHPKAATQ